MNRDERRTADYEEAVGGGGGEDKNNTPLTAANFRTILEVNKKSIEIYLEVEKQNEDVLDKLKEFEDEQKLIKDNLNDMDKNLFRLVILLGGISVGTIASIIKILFFIH